MFLLKLELDQVTESENVILNFRINEGCNNTDEVMESALIMVQSLQKFIERRMK